MTNNMVSNVSSRSVCLRRSRRNSLMALTFILGVAMGFQRLLSAMLLNILLLSQERSAPDVRFGSKADIEVIPANVRFTPKSGHLPSLGDRSLVRAKAVPTCRR